MNQPNLVTLDLPTDADSLASAIRMLPPLPDVAQQILDRFGDEYISASEVAAIVECDPAISARLFGLANSAYFGLSEPVTDMRKVVSRVLGPDTVRSMAFALAADRTFDLTACDHFDARRFWHTALNTAACARRIAKVVESLDANEREFAYLTGLCHNLGLLVVACTHPGDTDTVLASGDSSPELAIDDLFKEALGYSLEDVTYELARHWDMPDVVINAFEARATRPGSKHTLANVIDASIATSRYLEREGKNPDGSKMEFPVMAAESLELDPDALKKASAGTERQRGVTESAVQAMISS